MMISADERVLSYILADELPPGVRQVGHEEIAPPAETLKRLRVAPEEWEVARQLYNEASHTANVLQAEGALVAQCDFATLTHMRRVSLVATLIALRLGYGHEDLEVGMIGSRVHDVGKVDARIRNIPSIPNLTQLQRFIMSLHVDIGISHPAVSALSPATRGLVGYHHTYKVKDPYGADEAIISSDERRYDLEKILAIADAYDALSTIRGYRPNIYPPREIMQMLRKEFAVEGHILDAMQDMLGLNQFAAAQRMAKRILTWLR